MCVLHTISFFLPVDMMGMNTRTHTRPRVHSIKFTNSTNEAVDLLWLPVTPIPRNSSEKKMTLPSSKIRKKRREKQSKAKQSKAKQRKAKRKKKLNHISAVS